MNHGDLSIQASPEHYSESSSASSCHWLKSSTGLGSRPSNHSAHVAGVKSKLAHSITQERKSCGPPFRYGGGDTGLNTVGSLSSKES